MAGTHQWIDLYNDIKAVDDFIAVEGEIISVDPSTNTATVLLPRWGTIPDIPIFYHCQGNDNVDIGYRAFRRKDIAIVIVLDGRTLAPPIGPTYASFLAANMRIVGHGRQSGRESVKQPYSCKWEDFSPPWWTLVGGVPDETHPASENGEEVACMKHRWDFNGFQCDISGSPWTGGIDETKGYYILANLTSDFMYAEWKSVDSWEGDDPKEADWMKISVEVIGENASSDGETHAWMLITDDLGNKSKLFFYNDDHIIAYDPGPPAINEYFIGDGIITNYLTNYSIFGRVSEVRIETAAKAASGNSIDLRLFYIDFY